MLLFDIKILKLGNLEVDVVLEHELSEEFELDFVEFVGEDFLDRLLLFRYLISGIGAILFVIGLVFVFLV